MNNPRSLSEQEIKALHYIHNKSAEAAEKRKKRQRLFDIVVFWITVGVIAVLFYFCIVNDIWWR